MQFRVVKQTLRNGGINYALEYRQEGPKQDGTTQGWRPYGVSYDNIDDARDHFLRLRGHQPIETEVVIPHDADYSKEPATSDIGV